MSTGALADLKNNSQTPPWIELPTEVWAVVGSHLGTRDFARASTVIKVLHGVQPLALNLEHILTVNNKIGELMWGRKHSSRVVSAVIKFRSKIRRVRAQENALRPLELLQAWSFPCIQELSLEVLNISPRLPAMVQTASASDIFLPALMPQLQFLELKASVSFTVPVIPRLRHLTIRLHGRDTPALINALESVAALPALQTLYAEALVAYNVLAPVVSVDLRACVSLQAVCLIGVIPDDVMLPPATRLTLDTRIISRSNVLELHRVEPYGLHVTRLAQLWFLMHKVNFRTLSALSLHKLESASVIDINLGDSARQLRFLSVTCISQSLSLSLSLPSLSMLIVHAEEQLELRFGDLEGAAARFDDVSIRWRCSSTVQAFEDVLRAHCRKDISAGVHEDPKWPEPPCRFVRTRLMHVAGYAGEYRISAQSFPCTVASVACGACLEHCCPPKYPVPQP